MKKQQNKKKEILTANGRLVVSLSKALFETDIERVFDILGKYLDENQLTVSAEMIVQYQKAGRIADRKIIYFSPDS